MTTYRLPGRAPTVPKLQRPLIVQLLMPLRLPLAFVVILAIWPLFVALFWLAIATIVLVFAIKNRFGFATQPTPRPSAPTPARATRAAAPAAASPANAIARTSRIPRR
jgi:hypothetical protein